MIYGLAIFLITLIVDLWTDTVRWYKEKPVNHVRGAALRLIGLVPAFYFMGRHSIGLVFYYWILFDGMWNVITGFNWFRIGGTAKLDKLQRRFKVVVALKYLLAVASVIFFIKYHG